MQNIQIEAGEHIINTYMPYAMTTIVDRALPDVRDGLKPIHRRILYSMYNASITQNKERAKSTEPISETMKIHPHGDTSIYDAIALMTEQNETLLHPFIDGEGAFGKVYSKDSPSAARYTFCRLNKFGEEFFKDINKNTIKFIGEKNHLQPEILTSSYPAILIKNNKGIAVGEACDFPSFNLNEVCDLTIDFINNKDITNKLLIPDFSTGGYLIFNKESLDKINKTGQGSIKLRSKYKYDKENNCIDIYEIPYSTTVDNIVDKITELMKSKSYKDIIDVRDETGFNPITEKEEMKITIDVRKNCNVDILMQKLFKNSPLESSYSANMNCLVNYKPRVLGIKQILNEWLSFRRDYVRKIINFDINKKLNQLHTLKGLEQILLNIDKAIKIIRNSESDELIIINLMKEFNIDETQANTIANMKLRNINKKYIINKIKNIEDLENEIIKLQNTLSSEEEINNIIINQLLEIKNKYGQPRRTEILYEHEIQEINEEDMIEDYSTYIILTKEGYLKKLKKKSDNVKLKDEDVILKEMYSTNKSTLLLFSNKGICYKIYEYELEECKPSNLGEYLPQLLQLDKDEIIINIITTEEDYKGFLINCFKNGKIAKIDLLAFKTKTKRSKLENAYNTESELINQFKIEKNIDILCQSSINKILIINTSNINAKSSKNTKGNNILKSKKDSYMKECILLEQIDLEQINDIEYYRGKPNAVGNFLKKEDKIVQI